MARDLRLARSAWGRVLRPLAVACGLWTFHQQALAGEPSHAIAMHGHPVLAADFPYFAYVNPNAPKGGQLTQAIVGTFDSLNPFIVRGIPADGLRGYVIESLMVRG